MNEFVQIYAYLVVYGEKFSPKDLSEAIDLQASCTGSTEQVKFNRGTKFIYWDYQIAEADNQFEFETNLDALCQAFEVRIDRLLGFVKQYQLQVKLVVDITVDNNKNASPLLPNRVLALVHELKANMQFDIHCR
ncbi:DUF4279 domain-containing protein [Hymenobacter ruber]